MNKLDLWLNIFVNQTQQKFNIKPAKSLSVKINTTRPLLLCPRIDSWTHQIVSKNTSASFLTLARN